MLKIRLQRVGRVHEPSFRLVLTDSKNSTKSGRFKEILGSYDPRKTNTALNTERLQYWISCGAGLTDTVHNLLVANKVINAPKVNVAKKSKNPPAPPAEVSEKTPETPVEAVVETPAAEVVVEAPKEEPAPTPAPAEKAEDAIIEDVVKEETV